MALVLQSNRVATNSIGNIHGIKAPNDYVLVLDFESERYIKRSANNVTSKLTVPDFLDFIRGTTAAAQDKDGNFVEYAVDAPRIAYNRGEKGLLLEAYSRNWFANPSAPVTQTITLTKLTERSAVSVLGSGSVTVSGANIEILSGSAVATEDNPVIFKFMNTSGDGNVAVTPSGSLRYVQLEKFADNINVLSSFIGNSRIDRYAETASLKAALVQSVLPASTEYTVVAHFKRNTINKSYFDTPSNSTLFSLVYSDGYQLDNVINDKEGLVKLNSSTAGGTADERVIAQTNSDTDIITAAVSVTPSALAVAANGYAIYKVNDSVKNKTLSKISFYNQNRKPMHTLQKLVIYNKALTAEELAVASSSWIDF